MKIPQGVADRLVSQETQIHQALLEARQLTVLVGTDEGKSFLDQVRRRETELARDYDTSKDFETVCRIQGQRMEARRLLLLLEGATERMATLQKVEDSWKKKLLRLVRRAS